MSKAAVIEAMFTNEQTKKALREDAHIYGLKYTEDMSEFGAYYAPEKSHGTRGQVNYVPGVIPEFALIDPEIRLGGGSRNAGSQTMHFGSPVTVTSKGTNLPWTIWSNGVAIGKSVDDGEEKMWLDYGNAGAGRCIFFDGELLANPNTMQTTSKEEEAYRVSGDAEAEKLKEKLKKENPDKEVLVGMLDSDGRLLTPIGAARMVNSMNDWNKRTKGLADDGESSLTSRQQDVSVANYNVTDIQTLVNGITRNYYMGKRFGITDDQKKAILRGDGATIETTMKVKKKKPINFEERTFEEETNVAPEETVQEVERYQV